MNSGTDAKVNVTYNGIPACTAGTLTEMEGECNFVIADPGHYDPDGVVNITALAWNLVSGPLTSSIDVQVLKNITEPNFAMLTTFSDFGSGVEGRGSQRNIFPAEYPVKFNCSYKDGTVQRLHWMLVCDVDGRLEQRSSTCLFEMTFPSKASQTCSILLTLENDLFHATSTRTIELKESVIFKSMTSNGPVKNNQTMTFTISLEKLGSDSCLWVDLGDNSSLLIFGDGSCINTLDVLQISPNIASEPPSKFFPKGKDTQKIVIDHLYPRDGSYVVRMDASNVVSRATHEMVAVIMAYVCKNPNVTIKG